jgi:hypothetical protein
VSSARASTLKPHAWCTLGLLTLIVLYILVSAVATSVGAAIGSASPLAMGIATVAAIGVITALGLMEAVGNDGIRGVRDAFSSGAGFFSALERAISMKSIGIAIFMGLLVLWNLRAVSALLPGHTSEVAAVIVDIRVAKTKRPTCAREAVVTLESRSRQDSFCVETRFGPSVQLLGVEIGKPIVLRIRSTAFYRVVESGVGDFGRG